ncbi:EAL domain-containing protein [Halomonas smyrnensis]|uniref:sensor domain-containing phosphodiesterase n=1 Tax=Halomonas smyrnensis TaxID=720605 RepID=UPI000312F3AD|nr:EAL domain-containing protein [Halomonas smyrnensis]
MDSAHKYQHQHLAGDTGLLMLIAGTTAMGFFGALLAQLGLDFHLPAGLQVTPGSAVSGLLAGLGLLALIQDHRRWRLCLSVLLAFFAVYLLVEDVGGSPQRVSLDSVAGKGSLQAVSATVSLMIAVGLWFGVRGQARRWYFKVIGGGLFLVGLASLLVVLVPTRYDTWHELQRMSSPLSSGFYSCFGLAMCYVAKNWQRFPLILGRGLCFAAVIGVTLSTLGWLLIGWQQQQVEAEQAHQVADVAELTGEAAIKRHEQALQRMGERWNVLGGQPTASLQAQEVDSYLRDLSALEGIAFIDGAGTVSWRKAQNTEALSRLEAFLDDDDVMERLFSQGNSLKWLFPSPDQPLKALIVFPIDGLGAGRLIVLLDLDMLLLREMRSELDGYVLHVEQGDRLLGEVVALDNAYNDSDQAWHPLARRAIEFSGAPSLHLAIFGGPPGPWSASSLLSTGVGAGSLILSYLLAFSIGVMRLSQARARQLDLANRQLQHQYRAQALIAKEVSQEKSLEAVCRMLERQVPGAYCSIMLCDETQTYFKDVVGPSLPSGYLQALIGVKIGPEIGACGSTAYSRELVVCEDLATDPRWAGYQGLTKNHELAACWSFPVISSRGQVLATVALYHSERGAPSDEERQLASKAVDLVALAIERHRDRQALVDSEQRYRSLFTHHPDAVFSLNLEGQFLSLNPQAAEITGLPTSEMLGKHFSQFVDTGDIPQGQALLESARAGHALRYELQSRDVRGALHVLDVTAIPITMGDRVTGVFGIAKDITARKADETRLHILERSVEASLHGILIVDATLPDMPIIFANHAFSRITGYSNAEIKGRNCRFLQGHETDPKVVQEIRRGLDDQRDVHVTVCNYRKSGEWFWNDLHISPVRDAQGKTTHYIGVINDVTESIADQAALAHQASHDPLTGAYNRAKFEERLKHDADIARHRNGLLVVFFIDLDDFKPINDTFGHAMGDRLLIAVAERLAAELCPGDTLGRFGGDEFLVLLPNLKSEHQAQAVVDRLLAELTRSYQVDDHVFRLSASIGMASSREVSLQHPEQLIMRADSAMYAAKKQGGNTAIWYHNHFKPELSERVELRKDIQEAIEREEFSLHYQPLMSYDGDVLGFEALIRWQHPTKGQVSPGSFIPVAEITGQIIPISEWVLEQVCRDLPILQQLGGGECSVAVNLSPMQFQRPTFLSRLEQQLEESHIPPHWLELEVTEGVLMEDKHVAISILHALRDLGVGVAIDDFGTGFSSLSYLKQLPVSKVKIDRSFIRDLTEDDNDRAIVQGIISMAQHMGLKVVAEGVETEDQLQCLADYGCEIFQGFLLAKPMPIEQLEQLLARTSEF